MRKAQDGFDPWVLLLGSNKSKESTLGIFFFDGEREEEDLCDCLTDTIQLFLKYWRDLHGNEAVLEIIVKMEKKINKDEAMCARGTEAAGIHGEHNSHELRLTSLLSFCTHCNFFREVVVF